LVLPPLRARTRALWQPMSYARNAQSRAAAPLIPSLWN